MIKISARRAALVAVPAALVSGAAFWLGASAVPASGHPKPDTIELAATTGEFAIVQHGTPGPALHLGDQIVSNDTLTRSGKKVGTDGVVCEVVKITKTAMTCHWTMNLSLPEGQLLLGGITDGPLHKPTEPLKFTLAVAGGTGRYQSARGQASIVDNPDETEQITIQLNRGL